MTALRRFPKLSLYCVLLIVALFAILGGYFLNQSHAAALKGDLNGDSTVNVFDLSILLSNWQQTGSGIPADLNTDGIVNIFDLSILLTNYGQTGGGGGGSLTADCFSAPGDCAASAVGGGYSGYPDPAKQNVGVPPGTTLTNVGYITIGASGCSGLGSPSWCSGSGTAGNPWVISSINSSGMAISTSNVRVQNSYIHASGTCSDILVTINNNAANVILSYDTIAGDGSSASKTSDVGVFDVGGIMPHGDHLLMYNENDNWEYDGAVSDSYIMVVPGFACTTVHYEPVYNTGAWTATHSVLFNPEEQTAVGLNDDGTCNCGTHMTITYSLIGGGGVSFYGGHPSTRGGSFVYQNNRMARSGGATTFNSGSGGTYSNPTSLTITGTLASGSATVTGLANVAFLWPGETIAGTGIPAGTTITDIAQSDSNGVGSPRIILSQPATVNGSQTLTIAQNGVNNAGGDKPGFDIHGFFPAGGYFGDSTATTGCTQSGNVWDDNNASEPIC